MKRSGWSPGRRPRLAGEHQPSNVEQVDAATFLGLEPTEDPLSFRLPITDGICTGGRFLFGGAGLGAGVVALERATGRPLVWATAQYLSFARPPSVLDVNVTLAVVGNNITQGRVVMADGGQEIITINAALGTRDLDVRGQWAERPDVPGPDECRDREYRNNRAASLFARLEERVALGRSPRDMDGTPANGRAALWARMPELEMSAAALAVLGDFVPFGVSQATGRRAGGSSLDNTLRVAHLVPTDWVLIDVHIHAIQNGFAHGRVHLWSEDGTLLATASQSVKIRAWR